MRDKIVTAVLGDDLYVKTSHVFQYDYGLTLMIEGIQLPAEYEIHFSNKKRGVAKKGELVEGGAKIPDEYLRSGDNVYAWVYLRNGDDDGYTIYSIEIPVVQRSVEQGDNIDIIEHNIIDKTIEELEEAVAKSEENVTHYPYIDTETHHWMVYDANQKTFVDTGIDAEGEIADVIDDTSGAGVTDKAWSADKLTSELDLKAPKANPEFTGSISMGRLESYTTGNKSVAIGDSVEASAYAALAEGGGTRARGMFSHSEGEATTASGEGSHAEGMGANATGSASHSEGNGTTASGDNSHAEGYQTIANHKSQHVFGELNIADDSSETGANRGNYVEIVGNGTGNNARSNARTLDWNGNEELAGDLTINKGSADEVSVSELADDVGDLKSAINGKQDSLNLSIVNGCICITYEEVSA